MTIHYNFKHLDKFTAFVIERHKIWARREKGQSPPWTKDEILAAYRFCNVYRELDRVTMWIARKWRDPLANNPDVWFAMVIARLINHPPTLEHITFPHIWNKDRFLDAVNKQKEAGKKVFSAAYIVSTNGIARDKAEYLADAVLAPMWELRKELRPRSTDRLKDFCDRLMNFQGMGTFIAAQVVADVKYTPPLKDAKDFWTFAMSGPGSRKGMAYLLGAPNGQLKWREHEWKDALMELSSLVRPVFEGAGMPRLHNQDLQNCLCEFSKYRRTQLGTGRPKQKFAPFTGVE
jgi:hypothetical protein